MAFVHSHHTRTHHTWHPHTLTAPNIKNIFHKLTFKVSQSLQCDPQFTFQMHPPFLSYMDNCLGVKLPSFCFVSSFALFSAWQTPLNSPLTQSPAYTSTIYCPKTTHSSGISGDHTVWKLQPYSHKHHSQSNKT